MHSAQQMGDISALWKESMRWRGSSERERALPGCRLIVPPASRTAQRIYRKVYLSVSTSQCFIEKGYHKIPCFSIPFQAKFRRIIAYKGTPSCTRSF